MALEYCYRSSSFHIGWIYRVIACSAGDALFLSGERDDGRTTYVSDDWIERARVVCGGGMRVVFSA